MPVRAAAATTVVRDARRRRRDAIKRVFSSCGLEGRLGHERSINLRAGTFLMYGDQRGTLPV